MMNGLVRQDFSLIADSVKCNCLIQSVYKSAVVSERCGDIVTTQSADDYWFIVWLFAKSQMMFQRSSSLS